MNQILSVENKKKKSGSTLEIKTVVIVFAICIILFGMFIVGKSVYGILTNNQEQGVNEPLVNVAQEGNKIKIIVKHDKIIDKIIYNWNGNSDTVLQGMGREEIEETITVPVNTNVLNLKVIDINKKTVSYSQEYTLPEGDMIKPVIELNVDGVKVKITAKDETALDYISYYWNDEDETKIEAREETPKQIEEKIEILKGENTLTVVAVDKAGNEEKVEQTYKGAKKPKIEASKDGNDLLIKVTDEEEILRIEYELNGTFYSSDPQKTGASLGMKEVEFKQPLASGNNKITIKVYNTSGLQAEFTGEITV